MRKRFRVPRTIYQRGKWYCFRITNSLGKRPEIKSVTREQAKLKLLEMSKQILSSASDKPEYRVTFEQGINFWLKNKKGTIDETSYIRYVAYMANFREFLSIKHPELEYFDEIIPEHIKEFMDYRVNEKGRATKTVNSEKQALYNLFLTLIDNNKMSDKNPVLKVKSFKIKKVQNRRCLSNEELYRLFEGAKAENDGVDWYGIYLTLYIGGFRRDEIRNLEKESVDLVNDSIKISNTKTDKPKIIPIHPQLKPVLQKAIEASKGKYVFPDTDGDVLHKNKIRDKMIQICEKVGIEKATPHELRHSFASRNGLSDRTKQFIGGWRSEQVMKKSYIHPIEEDIKKEYFNTDFIPQPKD